LYQGKRDELTEVRKRHFSARTPATKAKYREQDKILRRELADLLKKDGWGSETAQQLAGWDPYDQNTSADFFDPEWMFGIEGGFDVVIGNPPYVRQEQITEFKPIFQKQYSCYTGTADLYVYFYERGIQALRENGVLVYISSNKYFRSGYGEKLRGYLGRQTTIRNLIDFGDAPVFTAISYPSIIVTQKKVVAENQVRALAWQLNDPLDKFDEILQTCTFTLAQKELTPDSWRLETPTVLRLMDKLSQAGKLLGEYVNGRIYRGIITGLNEAMVVDRPTHDRLISEHSSSAEVLKPFLRGRDVKRWQVRFGEQYLIKIESSENKKHPWSGKPAAEAEKIFAHTYPAISKYLNSFREALIQRDDQGHYFWELRSCVYWSEFEKPKIIYPDIYEHQSFAFDEKGYFSGNTSYFIPTNEVWLCGLFNSKLIEWFYSRISNKLQSGYLRAFTDYMKKIPIPKANEIGAIEKAYNSVLAAKRANSAADTTELEKQIDRLVYDLYRLTEEEKAIVEGKKK